MNRRQRLTLHCQNAGDRISSQLLEFYLTLSRRRIEKFTPRPGYRNSIPALRQCVDVTGKHTDTLLLMEKQIHKDTSSGIVRVQDDKIFWEYDNKVILEIDVRHIVVIGEYTNSDGPYFDDWFLTFVTKDGQWQSIPWYADNRDELLKYLSEKFQPDFNISYLTGSFEWKSIVRHPTNLKGKALFKLTPTEKYKEPKTIFDKILSSVGLGGFDTTKYVDLTEEVKNELTNASR